MSLDEHRSTLRNFWTYVWGKASSFKDVSPETMDYYAWKLGSRKFRQLLFFDFVIIAFAFAVVCLFHVRSSAIVEESLRVLRDVTIAYFGLNVLQKGIEARRDRREREDDEV